MNTDSLNRCISNRKPLMTPDIFPSDYIALPKAIHSAVPSHRVLDVCIETPYAKSGGVWQRSVRTALMLSLMVWLALAGSGAARAVVLVSENFKNSSAPGWTIGTDAFLTSGNVDPASDGYLRLTPNANNKKGYAVYNTAIPTNAGVKISFDFIVFGGGTPGADGIAFFLLDGTTANPQAGAYGGSLGYAQKFAEDGVPNGYVGIGLDEYGNYSNPTEGRDGGIGFVPQAVVIRGSGNGKVGYKYLTGSGTLTPTLDFANSATRPDQTGASFRRCIITIDSNRHITVQIRFGALSAPVTVISDYNLNAASGQAALPSSFKFGLTSSTGGSRNFHEIRNFVITTLPSISGHVYADANHNASYDNGETGTGVTNLFAKLIPNASSTASVAVPVDAATGAYIIANTIPGTYKIIVDDNSTLSDVTPYLPPGYIGTEAPTQTRFITIVNEEGSNVAAQNFGLYHGERVDGSVFRDSGVGAGGVANNGVKDGGEPGIAAVPVKATNSDGTTTYDTFTTRADGTYTLFVPFTAVAGTKIVETNASGDISTGAQVGNTSGTYDRPTDAITFTPNSGTLYTGVNFGDVPTNGFSNDGAQTTNPGNTIFYPHVFTAGSGGTVSFNTTAPSTQTPAGLAFTNLIYRDTNNNGVVDAGEPIITPTDVFTLTAGENFAIIVKENVPANAPENAKDTVTVNANFTYTNANPALSNTISRTDTTGVTIANGLVLTKTVSTATALPGSNIVYTLTYTNNSDQTISGLVINDNTPAFTTFVSVVAGAPPTGLTGPTIVKPTVGTTGNIKWSFGGTLAPQATGSVTFTVKVN